MIIMGRMGTMKYRKSMFIVLLAIFLFSLTGVFASEMDTPVASEDTGQMELSMNDKITVDSIQISEDNDECVSTQTDSDGLSANVSNSSRISSEKCFEENLESKQDNDYGTGETSSDGVVIARTESALTASAAKDSIPIAADKLQNNVIVRANNVIYGQENPD